MASTAVMAAIEERLVTSWAHTPIRTPNPASGSVPDDGSAFLMVSYPVADEEQMSIGSPGSNVWREGGAVRFVLAIPAGTGLGEWPARLDELRAAFRGQAFGGLRTYAATPPINDGRTDDDSYHLVSFAVAYDHDLLG